MEIKSRLDSAKTFWLVGTKCTPDLFPSGTNHFNEQRLQSGQLHLP